MSLNYVSLVLDLFDGAGNPVISGSAQLVPSVQLTDTTDDMLITQSPVIGVFQVSGVPTVRLLATDNGALSPSGWGWEITFVKVPGSPASFSFFLPYAGGSTQYLSSLSPTSSVVTMAAYMLQPSGTATAGTVPIASGTGEASAWGNVATNPMTTSGDTVYGGASGALTRLAGDTSNTRKFLRELSISGTAQAPVWDTLQAGDIPSLSYDASGAAATAQSNAETYAASQASTAQSNAETYAASQASTAQSNAETFATSAVATETSRAETAEALALQKANNLSDLGTRQTALNNLAGAVTSGDYLRGGGTNVTMSAIQAADLPTATTSTIGAVQFDGTAGDIKPVGTAAAVGASGKAPDASHVHLGFFGGIFGSGSDGSVTFDGSTTILGMAPSSSIYTMTRDIQCTSITINNGVTLKPANYRIFCQGTVTNNGTISALGNAGSGSSAGGTLGSASTAGGRAGGAGGTGVSGAGASGSGANWGTAGGNGGAGTSGGAGNGGAVTQSGTIASTSAMLTPFAALAGSAGFALANLPVGFGAGGGGGGSDASSNAGGGGGGGGGVVLIFAWAVNNGSGTITVQGGAGAAGAAGNSGGGGGGSGGAILVYTLAAWTAGSTTITGGALGAGHGTGSGGATGGTGILLNTVLQ